MPKDVYIQPDAPDPVLSEELVLALVRRHVPDAQTVTGVDESGGEAHQSESRYAARRVKGSLRRSSVSVGVPNDKKEERYLGGYSGEASQWIV